MHIVVKKNTLREHFLKEGSNLLFATDVDYGYSNYTFRGVPLYLLDAVKRELQRIGFGHYTPDGYKYASPQYRIFYRGPRRYQGATFTPKANATSFNVMFYNTSKLFEEA